MKGWWIMLAATLTLASAAVFALKPDAADGAPAGTPESTAIPTTQAMSNLPNYGPAPELNNAVWLNTPQNQPLRLAGLRGKVVLLEFWTFDCINCIRTIPYVQTWHEHYQADGLVVIGDHFPEFSFEHDLNNLKAAMVKLGITYAVAQDNDGQTWQAYNQNYWPTLYLIDKQGSIRYRHIGEGAYDTTEASIRALLAEPYSAPAEATAAS